VGDKAGEAGTLSNLAFTKRLQGNLTEALTDIEAAIPIIEDLRTKIDSEKLRQSYFAGKAPTLDLVWGLSHLREYVYDRARYFDSQMQRRSLLPTEKPTLIRGDRGGKKLTPLVGRLPTRRLPLGGS
jgi:hypothetical protein